MRDVGVAACRAAALQDPRPHEARFVSQKDETLQDRPRSRDRAGRGTPIKSLKFEGHVRSTGSDLDSDQPSDFRLDF